MSRVNIPLFCIILFKSGFALGVIFLVLMGLICFYTCYLITKSADSMGLYVFSFFTLNNTVNVYYDLGTFSQVTFYELPYHISKVFLTSFAQLHLCSVQLLYIFTSTVILAATFLSLVTIA